MAQGPPATSNSDSSTRSRTALLDDCRTVWSRHLPPRFRNALRTSGHSGQSSQAALLLSAPGSLRAARARPRDQGSTRVDLRPPPGQAPALADLVAERSQDRACALFAYCAHHCVPERCLALGRLLPREPGQVFDAEVDRGLAAAIVLRLEQRDEELLEQEPPCAVRLDGGVLPRRRACAGGRCWRASAGR